MKTVTVLGIVILSLAIATSLLLGTLGWFAVGFGVMTDCTNNYSCSESGCSPCATTERWIIAGGIAQWILAGTGVTVLVLGLRARQRAVLAIGGVALLVLSVLTIAGTTRLAQQSYCQPGTEGYAESYCDVTL